MVRGNEAERRGEGREYISKGFFRVSDSSPLLLHSLTTHSFHLLRSGKFYTEDARLRSSSQCCYFCVQVTGFKDLCVYFWFVFYSRNVNAES